MVSCICGIKKQKVELIETESTMVVARGCGWGEWGAAAQGVLSFSYAR